MKPNQKRKALNATNFAIDQGGGDAAVAEKIGGGLTKQAVNYWRKNLVPANRVLGLIQIPGVKVFAVELRPDIFIQVADVQTGENVT